MTDQLRQRITERLREYSPQTRRELLGFTRGGQQRGAARDTLAAMIADGSVLARPEEDATVYWDPGRLAARMFSQQRQQPTGPAPPPPTRLPLPDPPPTTTRRTS